MSDTLLFKLLAIVAVVALGWVVGRARWLGPDRNEPARALSGAAFYLFVPALLFRTTARIDLSSMPWATLAAFFLPVVAAMLGTYLWSRRWRAPGPAATAAPSVRALTASFGNTVQVGVPMAAAVFGDTGLALHVTLLSLHALTLLSIQTTLVELDLARDRQRIDGGGTLAATLLQTARNTIIHPVVLPVLAGLAWNALKLPLPGVVDELLVTLGQAVVPLCLVLIGLSLAYNGAGGSLRGPLALSVVKLLVLPAVVLVLGHWVFGLSGLPLGVVVMAAALPTGSNALIFSQRYDAQQGETSATIVLSTVAFAVSAPLWIAVLQWIG